MEEGVPVGHPMPSGLLSSDLLAEETADIWMQTEDTTLPWDNTNTTGGAWTGLSIQGFGSTADTIATGHGVASIEDIIPSSPDWRPAFPISSYFAQKVQNSPAWSRANPAYFSTPSMTSRLPHEVSALSRSTHSSSQGFTDFPAPDRSVPDMASSLTSLVKDPICQNIVSHSSKLLCAVSSNPKSSQPLR